MQPAENPPCDNIAIPARHSSQRQLSGHQKRRTSSISTQQISNGSAETDTGLGNACARPFSPASKRLKTSHTAGKLKRFPNMSKTAGVITRPGVIDLTRPSNFQPHAGARRLVIKNLRTTSRKDIDEYYESTWADLDAALTSIFNREQPASPLEVLCRGVEAICRRGRAERLSKLVKDRSKAYLEKRLLPVIEREAGPGNVDTLRTVYKFWTMWNEQSVMMNAQYYPGAE
jgi:cullin 4